MYCCAEARRVDGDGDAILDEVATNPPWVYSNIFVKESFPIGHGSVGADFAHVFEPGSRAGEGPFAPAVSWVGDVQHHLALGGVEGLKGPTVWGCRLSGVLEGQLLGHCEVVMG